MRDMRSVVCDDDPMIAMIASMLLKSEGFEVTTVGSAAELASELAVGPPDLVVLDQELPDASGEELIAVIKAAAPACRIILFSGREPEADASSEVFARVSKQGTDGLAAAIHRAATE